jgi:EAL domain-containing protein (putative c-di-GMP-specific phosphodiesterase class I)
LEEAAGISRYKERRRETENRIGHTRENLDRLNDLREEVEKQIRHLQRQAATARRYQTLKEEERKLQAELLALRMQSLDAEAEVRDAATSSCETAMHAASSDEPNCVHFFTSSMNASALERLTIETNLRTALEREELLVCYQPKIDIASGAVVGVEALLRWDHPELGMVSPAQFIPIAEETGLIMPIGEYVLRVACEQNKKWQDEGHAPIRMAVNLSTVQFRDPQLHKVVTRVLRQTGLAPEWLELELTESVLLQKADATIATLRSLKEMGVHLAIDDFGTGYSSLSYLKRFPIDSLKIDQSFIREVTTNPEDAAITTSIILMGRSLHLRVVAEGVESHSQLAFLKVLECDEAQGFLFSRPVPADDVSKLFATRFLEPARR